MSDIAVKNNSNNTELQNTQPKIEYLELAPDCDIEETKEAFVVNVDMPGVDKSKIKVELDRDILTVDAFEEIEGLEPRHYERQFRVLRNMDPEKIKADYKQGVLNIMLPKPLEEKKHEIKIQCEH